MRAAALVTGKPVADGCAVWRGAVDRYGYGRVGKQKKLVHRLAWEQRRGPIPEGQCVLHRCDRPACVNLDHLFLGTHQENMADRDRKGRQATAENGRWAGGRGRRTRPPTGSARAAARDSGARTWNGRGTGAA